jgi:hypothetical protein
MTPARIQIKQEQEVIVIYDSSVKDESSVNEDLQEQQEVMDNPVLGDSLPWL